MKLDAAPITVFQEKSVPDGSQLAGWAALVQALAIPAPVRRPSCVSEQHIRGSHRKEGIWTIFDKRYWPGDAFADHLLFALRHEDIDLLILKRVFEAVPQGEIEAIIHAAPTGIPARRSYTIASTPTWRDRIEITVKREDHGLVSRWLHDELRLERVLHVHRDAA